MESQNFCQSCGMPLDSKDVLGTEKYGSLSLEYCKYCYQHGEFTNPEMTLGEMKAIVVSEMEQRNLDPQLIEKAVDLLPRLKRWKMVPDSTVISI